MITNKNIHKIPTYVLPKNRKIPNSNVSTDKQAGTNIMLVYGIVSLCCKEIVF